MTLTDTHRSIIICCDDVQGLFMRSSIADESVTVALAIGRIDPVIGIIKLMVFH